MDIAKYNQFIDAYWSLKEEADFLKKSVEQEIESRTHLYFWPNENPKSFPISGRIKTPDSFWHKVSDKVSDPTDSMQLVAEKNDLVGVRFIISRRSQMKRAVALIRESEVWDVHSIEAFTDDAKDKNYFEHIGLLVENKRDGYCGVHFDVKLKNCNRIKWVEIQLRTRIQDAWQDLDHVLYKSKGKLPNSFSKIRSSIASQFETAEKAQQFIFQYIQDEIACGEIQIQGSGLYHAVDWSEIMGLPQDYINKLIRGDSLDCYYFVDKEMVKHALVLEDATDKSSTLIVKTHLQSHYADLIENVISVSDYFLAAIPLAGNITVADAKSEM
ncbi:MAG: RelA/SpoT domain-containing protein [Candidatus Uhrbacteria bacterium]|nr:RelA/SpoT domain-containing protein [Candidatus Uhrbacteria bacterium]